MLVTREKAFLAIVRNVGAVKSFLTPSSLTESALGLRKLVCTICYGSRQLFPHEYNQTAKNSAFYFQ